MYFQEFSTSSSQNLLKNIQYKFQNFFSDYVFHPQEGVSHTETKMRSKGMRSNMSVQAQQQNCHVQMKKARKGGMGRTKLQSKVRQTDYSRYSDDECEDDVKMNEIFVEKKSI